MSTNRQTFPHDAYKSSCGKQIPNRIKARCIEYWMANCGMVKNTKAEKRGRDAILNRRSWHLIKDQKRWATQLSERSPGQETKFSSSKASRTGCSRATGRRTRWLHWSTVRKKKRELGEECGGYCEDFGLDSSNKLREMSLILIDSNRRFLNDTYLKVMYFSTSITKIGTLHLWYSVSSLIHLLNKNYIKHLLGASSGNMKQKNIYGS